MKRLTALIADDEPLARERLRFLLSSEGEVEVGGECRNGREVIAALRAGRYDVLFLDIQMPGLDGFAVTEEIGPAQMPVRFSSRRITSTRCRRLRCARLITCPSRSSRGVCRRRWSGLGRSLLRMLRY